MKKIKVSKVNVGDWISTESIFSSVNKNNELEESRSIAEIIEMKKKYATIKYWKLVGKEIIEKGKKNISKEFVYNLLDKKEVLDIKKRLILENLK